MRFFETIAVAFSMFSAIPMPQFVWSENNMRYAMCAFPLVGAVIGGLMAAWRWAAPALELGSFATAAGFVLLPLLVTGGIHLDGFCDTVDALSSHQGREKMLEIMKDPHAGAFAVIGAAAYLIAELAICSELHLDGGLLWCLVLMPVLTRIASGFAVAAFPCAKNTGLAHAFAGAMVKKRVRKALLAEAAAVCMALMLLARWKALAVVVPVGAMLAVYYEWSKRTFGGITGDLAGWFLQSAELCALLGIAVAGRIG